MDKNITFEEIAFAPNCVQIFITKH